MATIVVTVLMGSPTIWGSQVEAAVLKEPTVVVVAPLSGEAEALGQQLLSAVELGALGQGLNVEAIDEQLGAPEVGRRLAGAAARGDVVAVVGPMRRRNARPVAQRTEALGLPTVVFSAQPGIEETGSFIFRGRLSAEEQARQLMGYAAEELGLRRLALLAPASDHGDELVRQIIDQAGRRDMDVVAMAQYEEGTTHFGPFLEILIGQRTQIGHRQVGARRADRWGTISVGREGQVAFDGLIIADHHRRVAQLLPFLSRVGIATAADDGAPVQLLGLSGWAGDGLALAGARAQGAIFMAAYGGANDGDKAAEVASHFQTHLDRLPTAPEVELYDVMGLLAKALERVESGQDWRHEVGRFLRSGEGYRGASGLWRFDRNGAPNRQMTPYLVVDEGAWVRDDRGSDD